MLREFELGLADVLGSRLPPPLQGAVDAAPARAEALVVVSVRTAEAVDEEMLSRRPERVPGATDPRRVLRLRCETTLEVRAPAGGTRADQMEAIDRVIYLLGEASLLDGRDLLPEDADADPGFLVQRLQLLRVEAPSLIVLVAEGYFWPVGEAGATGIAIRDVRIRQSVLPLLLSPAAPRLIAGGATVDLTVRFGNVGMRIEADAPEPEALPFGDAMLSLVDAGGRPGAGVLAGGGAGPEGTRVIAVNAGQVSVQYTPPAAPATDFLVVRLDNGEGEPGQQLGKLRLVVRSA
ncbi:hypothetical protein QTI66_00980 [Variovorax sp. J22R133]|uniref:hypothetical protein n=1 Tax=Variovorax brevis TaxID=3053503 RepID=UPI002575BA83|nr:hypothetical protein [Variovorax sp. J22R133]MDM0110699.1 hypothetical protein [Variovorax sp. J22R133]